MRLLRAMRMTVLVALLGSTTGCAALNQTEKGAIIGGTAGAILGTVMGEKSGNGEKGAVIGAVTGTAIGAIIGREVQAQTEALEEDLEGAEVSRHGDQIHVTFESGILFGFDSDDLRPEAAANLDRLAQNLLDYPGYDVRILGHTDNVGTAEYNRDLSTRRAEAAANHLISRGIAPNRIFSRGMGMAWPVASNETEAGRQENRRVEVEIYASQRYLESLQEEEAARGR